MTVQAGGMLKGSGIILGNVVNVGTISPGNSPGTLTISGNFTQGAGGTYNVEIFSPQNYSRLVVLGHASLDGTLHLTLASGFRFQPGQTFTVLTAQGISGTFRTISGNTPVQVTYANGQVIVNPVPAKVQASDIHLSDGTPVSTTALLADYTFYGFGSLSERMALGLIPSEDTSKQNAVSLTFDAGEFDIQGQHGQTYTIPIAGGFKINDRVRLDYEIPLQYITIDNTSLFQAGLTLDLPVKVIIPTADQPWSWILTPTAAVATSGSKEIIGGGALTNVFSYQWHGITATYGNYISFFEGDVLTTNDPKFPSGVSQQIMKNGLRLDIPFAKSWILEAYGIYTQFFQPAAISSYWTIGAEIGHHFTWDIEGRHLDLGYLSLGLYTEIGNQYNQYHSGHAQIGSGLAFLSHGTGASSAKGFKLASKSGLFGLFRRTPSIRGERSVKVGKSAVRGAHSPGGYLLDFPAMADSALKPTPASSLFTATSLKALMVSLLLYWGACALLLPVTTSDCQVYNLARLRVAEQAGFWQAEAWNSIREVTYPWVFDAVHYPFLKAAWGFGIPSFLAFLGLLVTIFHLVAPRFGEQAALWSILTLLSMPTLMLQATATKNDLIVVFGVGCWIYSLVRFRRSRNKFFLFAAALSLAFIAGSKNVALGISAMAALATGWLLRREFRSLLLFALFLGPLLLLFGSIETYLLSWKLYHDPIGPKQFVTEQLNGDGLRGAIANFFRYYLANISLGVDGIDCHSGFSNYLEKGCRVVLESLGLQDAGCRRDFKDATLPFLKDGFDSGYDFGVVGCLALLVSSWVVCRPKWQRSPLGVERRRIHRDAAHLLGDCLDTMGCALFLPQLYAFWHCSGAAGVRCTSPRRASTIRCHPKIPLRDPVFRAMLFRPFMASAWFQRGHPLVGYLTPIALWAAKTFGFMECALCASRCQSSPKTRNDTRLQGRFKPANESRGPLVSSCFGKFLDLAVPGSDKYEMGADTPMGTGESFARARRADRFLCSYFE